MHFTKIKRKNKETYEKFKKLYKSAFPKEERRALFILWITSKLKRIDVFALEDEDKFVGLLITAKDQDLVWVDYLAISPEFRGQGYGSQALSHLKEYYDDNRIFLEVETPHDQFENYHQRLKRIEFYKQNGFKPSGLRVNCFDCDFTILSYNGKVKFNEYLEISKSTYGRINHFISNIEKIEMQDSPLLRELTE